MATEARVSQAGVLAVTVGSPAARVSQAGLLVVNQGSPKVRVSQVGMLVITNRLFPPVPPPPAVIVARMDPRFLFERDVI